jgi:hypothetical protein
VPALEPGPTTSAVSRSTLPPKKPADEIDPTDGRELDD